MERLIYRKKCSKMRDSEEAAKAALVAYLKSIGNIPVNKEKSKAVAESQKKLQAQFDSRMSVVEEHYDKMLAVTEEEKGNIEKDIEREFSLIGELERAIHKLGYQEQLSRGLFYAAEKDDFAQFKKLMSEGKEDAVISLLRYEEILNTAIKCGYLEMVEYAIKNADFSDNFKSTTFNYAVQNGQLEIVKMLLNNGVKAEDGLLCAVSHGKFKIAKYLIEYDKGNSFYLSDQYSNILKYVIAEKSPSLLNLIVTKYPKFTKVQASKDDLLEIVLKDPDFGIIRILNRHFPYIDVNHQICYFGEYQQALHRVVVDYTQEKQDGSKLHEGVRLFVAYGADVSTLGTDHHITARELLIKECEPRFLAAFDTGVIEGLEIWRWNQKVMRGAVKYGGGVILGDVMGIGKNSAELILKFAPAQFEEKLELGTVRVLRAQAMLEMGHGVTFGDVHHGGYVKYWGGTTVTCDWHVEFTMKVWCGIHGQHCVGHDGKMPHEMQHSAYITHTHMAKVVYVGGDSYVDREIADLNTTALYKHVLKEMWTWGEEHLQQNGNEMKQCMHVLGEAKMPMMSLLQSDEHEAKLHVWGDAYDQKLHTQYEWYVRTGETLPTFVAMTQSHHDTTITLDDRSSQTHVHDEAAQQDILQVVPQLTHLSTHHLQLHIPHEELQHDASEPHSADFLHSISML